MFGIFLNLMKFELSVILLIKFIYYFGKAHEPLSYLADQINNFRSAVVYFNTCHFPVGRIFINVLGLMWNVFHNIIAYF